MCACSEHALCLMTTTTLMLMVLLLLPPPLLGLKSRTSKLSEAVAAAATASPSQSSLPPKTRVGLLLTGQVVLAGKRVGCAHCTHYSTKTNEDGPRLSHLGDNFRDNNLLLIYSTPCWNCTVQCNHCCFCCCLCMMYTRSTMPSFWPKKLKWEIVKKRILFA